MSTTKYHYICNTFKGHNPVGSAAVMYATDKLHAAALLQEQLAVAGLPQKIAITQILEWEPTLACCRILVDGEY